MPKRKPAAVSAARKPARRKSTSATPRRRAAAAKPSRATSKQSPRTTRAAVRATRSVSADASAGARSVANVPALYGVHPAVVMIQKWVAEFKERTGRTLAEWLAEIKRHGFADEVACRAWLKDEHGFGTNTGGWLANRALGRSTYDDSPATYRASAVKYVEDMYAGPKAGLRLLHDRLIALARSLGSDVQICPCTTMVPIYRNHVIAQIKPTTRTRIDFGLALRKSVEAGERIPERLAPTGGLENKDRITHCFALTAPDQIDAEVERWLRRAYAVDA